MTSPPYPLSCKERGRIGERLSENKKSVYCHSVLDTESRGGDEVVWILAFARMTFSDNLYCYAPF
jgi:hypothetical protein